LRHSRHLTGRTPISSLWYQAHVNIDITHIIFRLLKMHAVRQKKLLTFPF